MANGDSRTAIAASFDRDGYYLARAVFDQSTLQRLESQFDRIVDQLERSGDDINARWNSENTNAIDGGSSEILHTHNVQRYSAIWLRALQDDRFLDIVEAILGPDIILHHTKLFHKPARVGSPFPIHQDWSYFPTERDSMIAGIIFLSGTDDESGGLRIYPGSHRLGRIERSSGFEESDTLAGYPLDDATPVDASPGDVLFFSYLTLHGSTPNRSDRVRKTVLAQFHSGRDRLEPGGTSSHVNEQLVLRGWNARMTRRLAGNE